MNHSWVGNQRLSQRLAWVVLAPKMLALYVFTRPMTLSDHIPKQISQTVDHHPLTQSHKQCLIRVHHSHHALICGSVSKVGRLCQTAPAQYPTSPPTEHLDHGCSNHRQTKLMEPRNTQIKQCLIRIHSHHALICGSVAIITPPLNTHCEPSLAHMYN